MEIVITAGSVAFRRDFFGDGDQDIVYDQSCFSVIVRPGNADGLSVAFPLPAASSR